MIDSKVILHDIFYDISVNFFMYLPHSLHPRHVRCYIHTSIQHLFTRQMFSVHAVQRYNMPRAITVNATLCHLVTQVHTCMPFLKAVHYAQTNVTFPAEIQRAPCLLYFQSTELGRSWPWSAP